MEHNSGRSASTKAGLPWRVVYQKEFATRQEAFAFEQNLKKKKSRKYLEWLISSTRMSN
jgi:putative endonuclease